MGWILNYEASTFQLPPFQLSDLKALLAIPSTQQCIVVPKLRLLVGKLRSVHMAVHGAIEHFYYIQEALTKAGTGTRSYLSKVFHREISHLQRLCADSLAWPHFLAEVVRSLPTALGFCDASDTGVGGVWIYPNGTDEIFVWFMQWPADIVPDLVSWTNPTGGIINSDLELAALVLQESCFMFVCLLPA